MKNLKTCPVCGNQSFSFFFDARNRYRLTDSYSYYKCDQCELVLLDEREDNKDFVAYNLTEEPTGTQKLVLWLFHRRLQKLCKSGKVLDFGAGAGNLSQYLKAKGYDVDSFEVDEQSKQWLANKRHLNVVERFEKEHYDVIIMEQVLEHLPNPMETMGQLKAALKSDGVFLISIPNINSFQARVFREKWFHLDAPRHVNHFHGKSFFRLMEKLDLKVAKSYGFNFHMDLTGWYWSMRGKVTDLDLKTLIVLGFFLPLLILNTITKTTAYVLYVVAKKTV